MERYEPEEGHDASEDAWEDFEDFDIEEYIEDDDQTKDLDFDTDEEYRGDPEFEGKE